MSDSIYITDEFGNKLCRNSFGKFHCEDGPSVILANGDKFWQLNGMPHRLDGPAHEFVDGRKHYYINGEEYFKQDWFDALTAEQKDNYIWNL